jgi:hypothetical protein
VSVCALPSSQQVHTLAAKVSRLPPASISSCMDEDQLSEYMAKIGRKGGQSRAKRLNAERRKEIATKASQAAAVVRREKANSRKAALARWAKKGR